MARRLDSSEFNDLPDDVIIGDVEVTLGGRYDLVLRPLTYGMVTTANRSATDNIRYGLVSGCTDSLGLEYEDTVIAGMTYRVATSQSVERLPVSIAGTLADIIMRITHVEQPKPGGPATDAEKIDFT